MLNPYVWNLYMETEGYICAGMFRKELTVKGMTGNYLQTIKSLQQVYCACDEVVQDTAYMLGDVLDQMETIRNSKEDAIQENQVEETEEQIDIIFEEWYRQFSSTGTSSDDKSCFADFSNDLPYCSTLLAMISLTAARF